MRDELRRTAEADTPSVIELASALIRQPSRGGIDDYEPVLGLAETWLTDHELPRRRLHTADGAPAGVVCEIAGAHPGPVWVLDACLDTAPFGDLAAWTFPPTAGDVEGTWIRGRGAADSKVAAAMFCHLAAAISRRCDDLHGTLAVLLDVDEHTGDFGGARAYLAEPHTAPIAGAMIGYPGLDEVVVGGRGVFRARVHVYGDASHSGSSKPVASNAISRAARFVALLDGLELPEPVAGGFPLPPKLTVTEIRGGDSFTTVPDHCVIGIDIRLTDVLGEEAATKLLDTAVAVLDNTTRAPRPTTMDTVVSWPPFRLTGHDQPAAALIAGTRAAGLAVRTKIAGPSNIGNLLAAEGIPATAGFGMNYHGLHGIDEAADLAGLPTVHIAYHHAALSLLGVCR
ncbi:M20/M25/M40 family metallo-hydrolase [Nocardia blacklockiae]|nr:M20/M25/M40 family metallo-hydrolase [Nocardia blacklockiae]